MANPTSGNGIEFYVDVDTTGAIASTKTIQGTNKQVEQSFKGVDTQVSKTSKAVSGGLSGVGRSAGQAGIQLQQFIGQIQGGQNAMLALSQQSADLGFVLGMPLLGAIVGIAASVGGLMLPSLLTSKDAVGDLKKAIEQYTAVVTLSKDGNAEFTSSLQQIASRSKAVAIELSNIAQARALIAAREAAKSVRDEFDSFGSVLGETFGSLSEKLGVTRQQLGALQGSAQALQKGATTERIEAFEKQIANIGRTGGAVSKETLDFKEKLLELVDGMRLSIGVADALKTKTEDFGNEAAKATDKVQNMISTIEAQASTVGMTERQIALYVAQQQNATAADIAAINASFDIIEVYDAKQKAIKENEQALKAYNDETMRQLAAEERAAQAARAKAAADKKALESSATGLAGQYGDPLATLQAQKDKELEILRNAEEQGLQLHTSYAQLRSEIDAQYAEKERAAKLAMYAEESKINELSLGAIESLGAATTNTLAGLLSGTYSATEAMQQFANTVLNQAIGALVDIGIQYMQNALISQAADKAILTSQMATKAANAATHTAAVAATVTELSSLAAAGAFSATAAIPIVGPALAPAAAAAAGAATAGIGATAVAAAPIAGARFNGGEVSAGSLYEVGEKNRPEMLMIPGNNGKVFSNAEMKQAMGGTGGGSTQIIINNNAPGVEVIDRGMQSDGVTEQRVIEIINAQSASIGSKLNQNINKNHNVTNRQGGNRRN